MNKYALAVSCSNEYAPYLSVLLQSIIDNWRKNHSLSVFVFETEICDEYKKKIYSQIVGQNVELNFIDPSNLLGDDLYIANQYFKKECYFRIAAPVLLKTFDKILFTDVDLIFNNDFSDVFDFDLGENVLAAIKDPIMAAHVNSHLFGNEQYIADTLKMADPYKYMNTGVLLFNVKEYIKNECFEHIYDLCVKNKYVLQEQDAISAACSEKAAFLPIKYNFTPYTSVWKSYNVLQYMPQKIKDEYLNCYKYSVVVHWACGTTKPWHHPEEDLAYLWWQYARKTPFYEEILMRLTAFQTQQQGGGVDLIRRIMRYRHDKIKYWRYKILSKITWGKRRKRYKQKRRELKEQLRQIRQIMK